MFLQILDVLVPQVEVLGKLQNGATINRLNAADRGEVTFGALLRNAYVITAYLLTNFCQVVTYVPR